MNPLAADPAVARLLHLVQQRDPGTALHMRRVSQYAGLIAAGLGLDADAVEQAALACSLHDLGKLGVPARILDKRGELTPGERQVMSRHVRYGHELLRRAAFPLAGIAAEVALHHHEKFDGGGYPDGLRGAAIPLFARIAAVADVFDALTSRRPQRCALGCDFALEYVRRQGGLHFDPDCIEAFLAAEERILDVRRRHPEPSEKVEQRQAGEAQV